MQATTRPGILTHRPGASFTPKNDVVLGGAFGRDDGVAKRCIVGDIHLGAGAFEMHRQLEAIAVDLCRTPQGEAGLLDSHRRLRARPSRTDCGCSEEYDIGVYETCVLGCRYSYGSCSEVKARGNFQKHDPDAPCLIP